MGLNKSIQLDIFDKKSINNVKKEIDLYKKNIKLGLTKLNHQVAESGIEVIKNQALASEVPNEIIESVQILSETAQSTNIGPAHEDAKFWEFGTGIEGKNNPHPNPDGWQYDVNNHGEKGWYYRGYDGKVRWTKGIKATAFMLKAYNELKNNASRIVAIAKEVFGD